MPARPIVVKIAPAGPAAPGWQAREGRHRRRRLAAAGWIGFGVAFAAGCVIAAFLIQPPPAGAPATTAPAAEGEAAGEAASEAPPVPRAEPALSAADETALAAISSVRLRFGSDLPVERQRAIADALARLGIEDVRLEALPFAVATSRVGYYRAEDAAAAAALARAIAATVADGGEIGVRDYGQLATNPEARRLDLWVGG